jgi:hypothetical protein
MIIAVANAADLIVLFAFILHLLFLSEFLRGLSRASVLGPFAPLHWVITIPSPTGHDGGVFFDSSAGTVVDQAARKATRTRIAIRSCCQPVPPVNAF